MSSLPSCGEQCPHQLLGDGVTSSGVEEESLTHSGISNTVPLELQENPSSIRVQTFWNDLFGDKGSGKAIKTSNRLIRKYTGGTR